MSRSTLAVAATVTLVGSFVMIATASAQWGASQPAPNPWAQPPSPPPAQQPAYPPAQQPAYPPSQAAPTYAPQAYPQYPPGAYPQTAYPSEPYVQQPPREPKFRFYGNIGIGVPIFLSQDIDLYRPGADLRFEGGMDFGYVAPFFDLGYRWTPIDFDRWARSGDPAAAGYGGFGRSPLVSFYFGVGARLQAKNKSIVTPYASGAFDMNFWNFNEVAVGCGVWYCQAYNVYRFTPGFTGRLGATFKIGQRFAIDAGLGLSMSFEGSFFDTRQRWLEPMIAFTTRR